MNATKVIMSTLYCISSFIRIYQCMFIIKCFPILFQSMIGHCLGAAGGLEAIATIKAITTGWVHPSINQFVSCPIFSNKCQLLCSFFICKSLIVMNIAES